MVTHFNNTEKNNFIQGDGQLLFFMQNSEKSFSMKATARLTINKLWCLGKILSDSKEI